MNSFFSSKKTLLSLAIISTSLLPSLTASAAISSFQNTSVTILPYIEVPGFNFDIKAVDSGKLVQLAPSSRGVTGVDFTFHDVIGFGVSSRAPQTSEDRIKKGDTTYQDYRFRFSFDSFQLSLNWQQYKGFYVENSTTVDPTRTEDQPYLQLPDLKLQNAAANLIWIISPESFSLVAFNDHTRRQEESGGSLLLGTALQETVIENNGPIIPTTYRSNFGADQNFTKGRFRTALVRMGGGYTLVFDKAWYLGGTALLGFGVQNGEYSDTTASYTTSQTPTGFELSLGVGYNGDRFVCGFGANAEAAGFNTKTITVTTGTYAVRIFAGTRF